MPNGEQLKMIQAIIERMARNSFALKGWSVTLAAALIGLATADSNRAFAWIAVGTVVVFGVLDAYYLAIERAYVDLYDSAAATEEASWSLVARDIGAADVGRALARPAVILLHGAALVAAILVATSG